MWLLIAVFVLLILLGPGWWVQRVLRQYSQPADRYRSAGTGAEFARHLLARHALTAVKVESTEQGDHYDPDVRAVRLSSAHFAGTSLTAITIAAHEVGHAVQHARGETLFRLRQRLARLAIGAERGAGVLLLAAPIITALTRAPQAGLLCLGLAIGSAALGTVVHLITLPVELDASFNKALPMLESGRHLHGPDLPHARRILTAAALTYVAGSLGSLLNLARWLAVLRR
jgi:uncharacterized protein